MAVKEVDTLSHKLKRTMWPGGRNDLRWPRPSPLPLRKQRFSHKIYNTVYRSLSQCLIHLHLIHQLIYLYCQFAHRRTHSPLTNVYCNPICDCITLCQWRVAELASRMTVVYCIVFYIWHSESVVKSYCLPKNCEYTNPYIIHVYMVWLIVHLRPMATWGQLVSEYRHVFLYVKRIMLF